MADGSSSPVLGKGSFGQVELVRHPLTASLQALKTVRKDAPKRGSVMPYECAKAEAEALRNIGPHPHIVKLLDAYETDDSYCMALEYYPGGDMLQFLRKHGALAEPEAASLFRQMLLAVSHLHAKGYIHRDLKLENLFLSADRMRVSVGDFGFAGPWKAGQKQSASWGSVHYSSPEICCGKSYEGPEVDAWSLGCCLYGMLHASLPFDAKNLQHTFERIEAGLYAPVKRGLSVDAQNLIMRFLQPNPAHRITVEKALAHPWMRQAPPMTRGASVPDVKHIQPVGKESPLLRPNSAKSVLNASLQQPASPHGTPSVMPAAAVVVAATTTPTAEPDETSGSSSSVSSGSDSLTSEPSLELAQTAPSTDGTEGDKADVKVLP